MRVLHLETGTNLYGGATQALTLMHGLAKHNIENHLVCTPDSAVAAAGRAQGLSVIPVPMSGDLDLGFVGRFRRVIGQRSPTLVHVHSRRGADTLGGLAARMAGVPAVLSRRVDSADPPLVGGLKYRQYQRVVAISVAIRDQLANAGVPDERLGLVRDAIDADSGPPAWPYDRFREEFELSETDSAIAVVAQMIERKGYRQFFKALTELDSNPLKMKVILFGSGPLESQLKKEVKHSGLGAVVRFAGFRPDLRAFLAHFQLLVHPAVREGLGLCLLEAQAAGVPVIGFRSGGVVEAVADGETGLLVRAGDTEGLGRAVTSLLNDADRRHRLGAAGPAWVEKHFGVERMVCGYADIYSQVLKGLSREGVDDGA